MIRYILDAEQIGVSEPIVERVVYEYAVVVSQACDLTQQFKSHANEPPALPEILFCQVATAESLRATPNLVTEMWKRIKINKDERYQFLENIPPELDACGTGLPEFGIDFKKYFTIPTEEVYRRIELGHTKRRSVLCSPYCEHLSSRFSYFLGRIGLPEDHRSESVKPPSDPSNIGLPHHAL